MGGLPLATTRAVAVDAPPDLVWRWVCQLALAPYSYDLLDNRGRRSPQDLVPGTERLVVGQRMAVVYDLVRVEEDRSWTGVARPSARRGTRPGAGQGRPRDDASPAAEPARPRRARRRSLSAGCRATAPWGCPRGARLAGSTR